jgi:death-on-curing protein
VSAPVWLLRDVINAVHDMQLAEHGGAPGVRDEGLLESALARPVNLHAYGEADLCRLAASYAFGIVRNHPFVDGNKRTGFLAAYVFLKINGSDLIAGEVEATTAVLALASGDRSEEDFADWLRGNARATTVR